METDLTVGHMYLEKIIAADGEQKWKVKSMRNNKKYSLIDGQNQIQFLLDVSLCEGSLFGSSLMAPNPTSVQDNN